MNKSNGLDNLESKLDFTIIVCTKNRPLQIESVVKQVRQQICPELKSLIVVDGSDTVDTESKLRLMKDSWPDGSKLEYIRTKGGKPTALNLSMNQIDSESEKPFALLFFDDDIHFNLQDFVSGMTFLYEHDFCGFSPLIINEGEKSSTHGRLNVFGLFPKRHGAVTKAGNNNWINANFINEAPWVETSWLPGGAVMYRFEKVSDLRFCEKLENPLLQGYALGDDVDFAMRASERGKIGCLRNFQVIHSPTQDSVRQPIKFAMAQGRWKAHLTSEFPERILFTRVVIVQVVQSIWKFLRGNRSAKPFLELHSFLVSFFLHLPNSRNVIIRTLHKRALKSEKEYK